RDMRHRNLFNSAFISLLILLGSVPHCDAQSSSVHVGVLSIDDKQPWFAPFERTLAAHGWIPGKNVSLEYRNAGGDATRFEETARELVRSNVRVIYSV